MTELAAEVISPLPASVAVGDGTALIVAGRCRHPSQPIARLEVGINGRFAPAVAHSRPSRTPRQRATWWGRVPIAPVERPVAAALELRAHLARGGSSAATLGRIELLPTLAHEPAAAPDSPPNPGEPLVAICLATWNPPIDLFRRQIESIREQGHSNWVCLVSDDGSSSESLAAIERVLGDDERFRLHAFPNRLGFYGNFERALALAPAAADFVALCDQDDAWEPDKLARLLAACGPDTTLAYSDMRLVTEQGDVISPTYWNLRETNHADLGKLLLANTVSGAAAMVRREVLATALPFPPHFGRMFHDHWLGAVALALGEIAFVDRPLVDYVQHAEAAQGHAQAHSGAERRVWWWLPWLRAIPSGIAGHRVPTSYTEIYLPAVVMAGIIRARCGDRIEPEKLRVLEELDSGAGAHLGSLALTAARPGLKRTATLGRERSLLAAIAWQRAARLRGRVGIGTLSKADDWS